MAAILSTGFADAAPTLEILTAAADDPQCVVLAANGSATNYVRLRVPLPGLPSEKHTFKVSAVDPGAVADRFSLQ